MRRIRKVSEIEKKEIEKREPLRKFELYVKSMGGAHVVSCVIAESASIIKINIKRRLRCTDDKFNCRCC